jgi:hypothetical protein
VLTKLDLSPDGLKSALVVRLVKAHGAAPSEARSNCEPTLAVEAAAPKAGNGDLVASVWDAIAY